MNLEISVTNDTNATDNGIKHRDCLGQKGFFPPQGRQVFITKITSDYKNGKEIL